MDAIKNIRYGFDIMMIVVAFKEASIDDDISQWDVSRVTTLYESKCWVEFVRLW